MSKPANRPKAGSSGEQDAAADQLDQQIDENLRRLYGAMVEQELPDDLKDLMERLKSKGTRT